MSDDGFQILIKFENNTIITLDVSGYDTIEAIKAKIYFRNNILPENQILVFNGRTLEEGRTLTDYSISKESIIYLFIRRKINNILGNLSKMDLLRLYSVKSYENRDTCLKNNQTCQRCGRFYYPICRQGYRMTGNPCGICYKI